MSFTKSLKELSIQASEIELAFNTFENSSNLQAAFYSAQNNLMAQCLKILDRINAQKTEMAQHSIKHPVTCRSATLQADFDLDQCQQEHYAYLDLKKSLQADLQDYDTYCI